MKKIALLFLILAFHFAYTQNLTSSLTACYALDGSAAEPVNGLTGTLSAITATVDRFNNSNSACHFTGSSSSYIQLPNNSLLKPTSALSFNMWVKFDDMLSHHYILYTSNGCSSNFEGYALTVENVSGFYRLAVAKANSSCSQTVLFGITNLSALTWYNIGLYVGNDSLKTYVNGVLDNVSPVSTLFGYSSTGYVYLGGTLQSSWNYPIRGTIDNVKFYNRKLTNQEFNLLYLTDPACGSFTSLTSSLSACYALDGNAAEPISGLTGTLGAVTSTVNRFNTPGSAYYFSGSASSYIELPNNAILKPTNAISFSAWIKVSVLPSGVGNYILFTKNTAGTNFEAYSLVTYNAGPSGIKFRALKGDGSGGITVADGTTSISTSNWYHVAMSIDNSQINIYVNGSLEGTSTLSYGFSYDPAKSVYFGGTNDFYNLPFNGIIDNARFYNRVLTATEVSQLYTTDPSCTTTSNPTPPTVAAFNAPDTVCVNQSFTVQNTSTGTISSYYWSACNTIVSASTQTSNTGALSTLSLPVFLSVNKDGSNYYMFVSDHSPGSITRFSYGGSLINVPAVTNLGNLGGNLPANCEGLWIEKEGSTWYGIMVGGPNGSDIITRLNFGNSLANTPSATNMGNIGGMNYPHRLQIFRAGGNVYGLTVNRSNNTITRFDFGNSLGNTPTGTNLGNIGSLNCPSDFSIINSGGNWYCYVCNDCNGTITRLDFGNSLLSTPSGTNIGSCGGLSAPRAISVWTECNQLKGIVHERYSNNELSMNFTSGPTGSITTSSLGNTASFNFPHGMERYRIGDTLVSFVANANSNSISRVYYPTCHVVPSSTLQTPPLISFPAPGLYTLSLVCNEGLYDQSSYCKTVYVTPAPSLSLVSTSTALCAGSTATLSSSGAQSYTWLPGNLTGSIISISPGSTTIYTVIGANSSGCSSSSTINIVVSNTLNMVASANPSIICQGGLAVLSASGGANYLWQPGNLTGASVTVVPTSSIVYTVTGTANGCSNSIIVPINLTNNPSVLATASPTIVCPGNSSTLTATGAINYTWQPGNLTGSSVAVFPNSLTVYTVTGANGSCSAIATVTVSSGLDVAILSSGNLCNNSIIDLSVSPSPTTNSIAWSGPGITGSSSTPTITVNAGGIYSVTVTNTLTGCSGTATFFVVSNASPLALNIIPSSTVACFPGPPVNFLVNASANLSWFPPGGVTPNTGPLVSVSPSVTSTYTVLATLGTCSGSAAITLSVTITPTVINTSGNPTICAGTSATLAATGALDYSWFPGNLSGDSVTVTPLVTTVYTLTGANGNCTSLDKVTVIVLPSPGVYATAAPATICIGQTSTLTATGVQLIAWLLGDPPPLSYTAAVNPTITTTYTAIGTNSSGCSATATIQINVINSPAISAVSSNTSICAGESVTLTASGATTNYTWMPGFQIAPVIINTPTSSITYTLTSGNSICSYATVLILVNNCLNTTFGITNNAEEPEEISGGLFKIRFTVTALNNSSSDLSDVRLEDDLAKTFSSPITYTVINSPFISSHNSFLKANPFFDGKSDIRLTSSASSTLLSNVRDTVNFTIQVDPNGFAGILRNSVVGFATTKYNTVVSDSSNNGFLWDPDQDGNPTNNNEITLITLPLIDLFIPGGFSPDGDGINDRFVISGLNDRAVKLSVFNRWGNKVYEKNNYDNSWDGTMNTNGFSPGSGKLPEAAYYYILQFSDKKKETKTGFVVLRN